jgi:hypothetical protein
MLIHNNWRLVLVSSAIAVSPVTAAADFTETNAIDVVRAATAATCTDSTPCTFQAQRANGRWTVIVEHTKRNSPDDQPLPYKGNREVFVLADGKIVMAFHEK